MRSNNRWRGRDAWSAWHRGRLGTVCARVTRPSQSSGPSTSPLEVTFAPPRFTCRSCLDSRCDRLRACRGRVWEPRRHRLRKTHSRACSSRAPALCSQRRQIYGRNSALQERPHRRRGTHWDGLCTVRSVRGRMAGDEVTSNSRWRGPRSVICWGPRVPGEIVGPRPLPGVVVRPLNFTV
jgi:hypothetical protein